jgi:hypothetical protein
MQHPGSLLSVSLGVAFVLAGLCAVASFAAA